MGKRGKRRQERQKNHGRPLYSRHHFIPRSRGGTEDWFNWGWKLDKKHCAWHRLFNNLKPAEVIVKLEQWVLKEYCLKSKEILSWDTLFEGVSYEEAIDIVKNEWFGPSGEIPECLYRFRAMARDYPIRIDCLNFASRMVVGEAQWSESWVNAFRAIADEVMKKIFRDASIPKSERIGKNLAGESVLDGQLKAIQGLFGGRIIEKFEMIVPIEIRYDTFFLFKLEQATRSVDGVVKYLDSSLIFSQIIHKLLAAIIFEEVRAGDKIIFAIDENNQPGIWRQGRPQEKLIK